MFQRILVPVDLTAKSLAAVDLAYGFAKQSKAEVILLHVIETIEHVQFDDLKPFYDRLENSARKGLREFSERFVAEKMRVDQALVYGHRSQEIVDYGKTGRCTIIRILPNPSGREDRQWYDIRFEDGSLARVPSRDLVQDKAA